MYSKDRLPRPTEAELQILRVLWVAGPSTVREVMEALEPQRPMGYTTILKFMQIMHEKGLLTRDESARSHIYEPAVPPERTKHQLVSHLVDGVFGGSLSSLMLGALGGKTVSSEELKEIRQLISDHEEEAAK